MLDVKHENAIELMIFLNFEAIQFHFQVQYFQHSVFIQKWTRITTVK